MFTVSSEEDNQTLSKWICGNQQTIKASITKDTMTFTDMIKGFNDKLEEQTKQDITTLTEMKGLSSSYMYRHYNIVLSKTSNKETMTDMIRHYNGARALFKPGCPFAINITSTTAELTWDEPKVCADFIHFYKIICEEKYNSVTCFFETPENASTFVVEGLKPHIEYEFKIQAIKNGGNKGTTSQTLNFGNLLRSNFRLIICCVLHCSVDMVHILILLYCDNKINDLSDYLYIFHY
ncbi:PTPRS [Mytilus coruscus]|uniref:PTPRS n=1 Tax=Mytilus coruscus TaxID=42192 RepID=A0A6J8D0B2_MYTCO|nr:PTPRS [Mytilus coruscus]